MTHKASSVPEKNRGLFNLFRKEEFIPDEEGPGIIGPSCRLKRVCAEMAVTRARWDCPENGS